MFAFSSVARCRTPLLLGALVLAAACTTTEPIGRVPVRLQVRPTAGSANATAASRVDLIISGPGINPNITATFLFDTSGTARGTLDVPVGSPRVLQLSIYDVNNVLLLQGTDTISVAAGVNAPAQVVVTPTTGSQPVVVVVGNYSLTVAPGTASIPTAGTQQFTATVRDAAGTTVTTPVRWASANPAFVTVDSLTGLARGVLAGATTVTATAFGIAATVPVTVSAP